LLIVKYVRSIVNQSARVSSSSSQHVVMMYVTSLLHSCTSSSRSI